MPRHVPILKEPPARILFQLQHQHQHQYLPIPDLSSSVFTVAEKINSVPGFRTSATFFTFLRSNLALPPSPLNSTTSTPLLIASTSQTLPPLPSSTLATMPPIDSLSPPASFPPPQPPLPAVPPLTTSPLTTEPAKVAALKLVADSIAQQRQLAARAVILHPLTLAAWAALLAVISSVLFAGDWGLLCTTCAGATMACLVGVRGVTSRYLTLAEELNWDFVRNAEGEEDVILGSRYGEELIGALVLRLERNGKRAKGGRGVIRAWTVGARYRGNGVGTELLEQAVKVTRKRLGRDSRVGFAAGHANSEMVLPGLFNAGFRRREMLAGRMLRDVVAGTDRRR